MSNPTQNRNSNQGNRPRRNATADKAKIRRERARRQEKIEIDRIKLNVRKRVTGKPSRPRNEVTIPGLLGKFTGKVALVFIIILVSLVMILGGTGLGIVVGYINTTEEIPNSLFAIREQTSHMYDKNGEEIAVMTGASNINREIVKYVDIANTYVPAAFKAIEDRSFDENIGIDPRRIISAVISTIVNMGDSDHGGSTITQQTVKMITGDDEVSLQRKVQEWYRAVRLTEQLSKSDIMGLYLNYVPMGNSYVGIQSAAKAYFGKNASELNLAESALLAGIPKSPSSYNLRTELGRKNAQRRQRYVLQAMLEEEMITVQQFEDALNYELVYTPETSGKSVQQIYSYFEEYVMEEVTRDLMATYGYSYNVASGMVLNGGLKIHTTQDPSIQKVLDDMFKDQARFMNDPSLYINNPESPEGAAIIFNNDDISVVAIQGGYGEKEANQVFNRATSARKSPASSIKPLAVHAPAIELDIITGATIIRDHEVFMDYQNPDDPWPLNAYRDYYLGDMTVRDTVKLSNNVPAAKILNLVGIDTASNFLQLMGYDMANQDIGLALATGSFTINPTPMTHGNAYLTFPNGGQYAKAKGYSKVLDPYGTVILEHKPEFTRVFSPETAFMMQKIMEEVLEFETAGQRFLGTARRVGKIENAKGEAIASSAKTGSAQNYSDEWIVYQTPYYTGVGWYGFDNRIKTTLIPLEERNLIHYVIGDTLKEAHKELEPRDWVRPAGIIELEICSVSGQLASDGCSYYKRTEYFKAGSPITPNEKCGVHSNSKADRNRLPSDVDYFKTGKGYGYGDVI